MHKFLVWLHVQLPNAYDLIIEWKTNHDDVLNLFKRSYFYVCILCIYYKYYHLFDDKNIRIFIQYAIFVEHVVTIYIHESEVMNYKYIIVANLYSLTLLIQYSFIRHCEYFDKFFRDQNFMFRIYLYMTTILDNATFKNLHFVIFKR